MIKVSVIVPVYGVEKYIRKCLDSLVKQTLREIEVIVVNDGTKDNCQIVIDEFSKQYPHIIKSYIKENGGQGSARNFGLHYASGKYISYVDSDDYIQPDMLEKMYNKAEETNSDIVICDYNIVDESYNFVKTENEKKIFSDNKINALLSTKAVWNKIYRQELVQKQQFRSKVWYEDFDFTTKIIVSASKIEYVNEPLYNYLLRQGSTMNNSNIQRNLEIISAFEEILKDPDMDNYRDIIEFLAIDHIYISAIVRIINAEADKSLKKECINKLLNYIKENFPDFHKNVYLKTLSRNRKIIYFLINLKLYFVVKLMFKIRG